MKAKKTIICILTATVFLAGTVQALDYDERRILFGENYAQIEKIAAGSVPVLKENLAAVKKSAETFHRDYSQYALEEPVFYREKAGSTVFYRAIFGIREASFPAFAIENLQLFFIERNGRLFLLHSCYLHKMVTGDGTVSSGKSHLYENINVVKNKDSFDLIAHSTNDRIYKYFDFSAGSDEPDCSTEYSGEGSATFYRLSDVIKETNSVKVEKNSIAKINVKPYRTAECGRTLIDKDRPFMYTIQNAFDGDRATSYVEDSEDDGISITVTEADGKISRIGIVNGYAASESLYAANNRIKTFTLNDVEHNFFDIFPNGYAYFPAGGEKSVTLRSSSVFKGSRFSDTCIADIIVE